MKIGIMSDSHGNVEYVKKAIKILEENNVDYFIHLGDNYSDVEQFVTSHPNLIRVPGVFSDEYQNHSIKNRIIKHFKNFKILITHTIKSHENDLPNDLKPEDIIEKRAVDVVLYGHTHLWDVKYEKGILFVNPGHLKIEDKKGKPPTFGILEIDDTSKDANVKIIGIDGNILFDKKFGL